MNEQKRTNYTFVFSVICITAVWTLAAGALFIIAVH